MKKSTIIGTTDTKVDLEQITDVASLLTGQPAYDAAIYDSDGWGE